MHTIQQDYVIDAPISEVWKAFTTVEMAEKWSAGSARKIKKPILEASSAVGSR